MSSRPRIQEKAIDVSPFALQWVRLEEDLDSAAGAQATRAFFESGVWSPVDGNTFTVYRPHADYSASADDVLPIYFNPAGKRYEIFQKSQQDEEDDHYADVIGFTITESTGGIMRSNNYQMLAEVTYISHGLTPPVNGDGELTVYDDQIMAPLACRNCSGWAFRNTLLGTDLAPYYQIIACDQMAVLGRARLSQTLDGFNSFLVSISSFQPDSEQPMGQMPIEPYSTYALNPHGHRAPNGNKVLLRWGSAISKSDPFGAPIQGYVIEDVEGNGLRMPVNFRVNQATKAIEVQRVLMFIETIETETTNLPWEQMFPQKNC